MLIGLELELLNGRDLLSDGPLGGVKVPIHHVVTAHSHLVLVLGFVSLGVLMEEGGAVFRDELSRLGRIMTSVAWLELDAVCCCQRPDLFLSSFICGCSLRLD